MTEIWLAREGLDASSASVGSENESVPKNMMENGAIELSVQDERVRNDGEWN